MLDITKYSIYLATTVNLPLIYLYLCLFLSEDYSLFQRVVENDYMRYKTPAIIIQLPVPRFSLEKMSCKEVICGSFCGTEFAKEIRGNYFYKVEKFHGRVGLYHMKDHHPPRLDLMDPFCKEVNEYLKADPRNVVAVHCKAGKGRTGVMICAYLVSINFYNLPRQVMDYYSIVRTVNNKGVTIPSQRRYVYYYAQMHKHNLAYTPLRIELVGVYVERPPQPDLKCLGVTFKGDLAMRVAQGDIEMFKGAPITITRQQWSEEEKLWAGKVPFGEDSYDPSVTAFDAKKSCVSRKCLTHVLVLLK
ncbi:hypothetical protein ANCCAN_01474 [Ancylostoma caninum]|uniref:phosphatidylinositol-3,4,5-trisphosphate 3-phosphatase n=1 Tax=Ancylostoma caninum TaxID=29170 RepID=A0A368H737_ANCCA|nr:hypothetical protein ANCCAN_01474 [Ancylostoma caninum]